MISKNAFNVEPVLIVLDSRGNMERFSLASFDGDYITLGRSKRENDVVISDSIVSGIHGYVLKKDGRFLYRDMGSRNGSYVETAGNRRFLHGSDEFVEISEGSVIKIGNLKDPERMILIMFTYMEPEQTIKKYVISERPVIIGRSSASDIVLEHPSVSRKHCEIRRDGNTYILQDSRSSNGVLVNGRRVRERCVLADKDVIQILGYKLIFCGNTLYYKRAVRGIAIRGVRINKRVGKGNTSKQILRDIDVDIDGNEFVAVIGGSGAGKSTLMNIINGSDRKFDGEVYYDSLPIGDNFQYLKNLVGYVPQDDIIYENLRLRRMLYYTALMRMPADSDAHEINRRIDSVLRSLDLKEHENTYIRKLSGGQKKRASIAVELLADPKLFFLDEPTSGLDPGTEKDLMLTLRDMSRKQDRTIVMVTHTTQNLDLCDKIIFMGPGGRVCFVGNVEEAKTFFGTDDIINAYNIIRKDPEKWSVRFRRSKGNGVSDGNEAGRGNKQTVQRRISAARQYGIITRRYIEIILNDMRRLAALLIQPVLIGILLAIVSDSDLFDIYESTKSMMFVLSCSAIWIGVFDSIQEICKERNILKREYMAGLSSGAYILSKMTVQIILGAIQAAMLTLTFFILVGADEKGILLDTFYFEMIMTAWLTTVSSAALGLVISSLVKTGDKAMAAAPFVLIVQLLFSGILFELKGVAEYISYITISRWSVEAMGSIARLNDLDLRMQAEFPALVHESEELFDATAGHLLQDWCILAFMAVIFSVISFCMIRNVSKDER